MFKCYFVFFNVAVNVFMYLPMTFHLESGEFNGNVAKTLELSFVHDFSLKREPIFYATLLSNLSKVQP